MLRDYLKVLRRRWLVIFATTLLGVGLAALGVVGLPRTYTATTQIFVSLDAASADPTTAYQGTLLGAARVESYAQLVDSPQVLEPAARDLGLTARVGSLASKVSAAAPQQSVLIYVSAEDETPAVARDLADAVAEHFVAYVEQVDSSASGRSPVKLTITHPAELPGAPTSPPMRLLLVAGLALGVLAGLLLVGALESVDTVLTDLPAFAGVVGAPLLGAIPAHRGGVSLLPEAEAGSQLAEAYRQLRTNLQFVDLQSAPRSIVVTSPRQGDGKTTVVANLALSLAVTGVRVAVVDADLRRPALGSLLGVESAAGLTDVGLGRASLEDVVQTVRAGVAVLPTGPLPPSPADFLAQPFLMRLIEELQERYDLVLIDAPPATTFADATLLASAASGAILVGRFRRTRVDQLRAAVQALATVEVPIFGVIANRTASRAAEYRAYAKG